jgi:hypothetical protein
MIKGKYRAMKGLLKKAPVFLAIAGTAFCFFIFANSRFHSPVSSQLTPWVAVGGCGSSAGSASGDVMVKWIGNGVSGALFDAELIMSEGALTDSSLIRGSEYDGKLRLKTTTALLSLYYHPPKIMDIKLSMPFLLKEGNTANTGGFGDLLLDLCRKWGTSGNMQTGLSLIVPTGYATIMNTGKEPLASDNQLGGGLFGLSLRPFSYTFDFDWGIINLGESYSGGLFAIKTTEYGCDSMASKITSLHQEFQFAREGWGARNDAGVFSPDFLGVFADFGIKTQGYTQGFSINYSYPLAQGNVEIRDVLTTYSLTLPTKAAAQTYVDTSTTSHHGDTTNIVLRQVNDGSWYYLEKAPTSRKTPPSLTLQYTIEKSDMMFPILVGGIVKLEYANRLNFAGIAFGLGFKFPVY